MILSQLLIDYAKQYPKDEIEPLIFAFGKARAIEIIKKRNGRRIEVTSTDNLDEVKYRYI